MRNILLNTFAAPVIRPDIFSSCLKAPWQSNFPLLSWRRSFGAKFFPIFPKTRRMNCFSILTWKPSSVIIPTSFRLDRIVLALTCWGLVFFLRCDCFLRAPLSNPSVPLLWNCPLSPSLPYSFQNANNLIRLWAPVVSYYVVIKWPPGSDRTTQCKMAIDGFLFLLR